MYVVVPAGFPIIMPGYEASDKLPGSAPDLFHKPRDISSGVPLRQKVIVTHRSDMLLEEQVKK